MTDHTAFDIDFDPTTQRMRGIAIHGKTPFDVPWISQITDNLWQGGCQDGLILPKEIQHVVSLYPWEGYRIRHELISNLQVRVYDDIDQTMGMITGIAQWVNTCRQSGVTLVHCQAGLNRSALVAGMALISEGRKPKEVIALLREKRSPAVLCNPAFEKWLLSWER